jgi:hypothetical protein
VLSCTCSKKSGSRGRVSKKESYRTQQQRFCVEEVGFAWVFPEGHTECILFADSQGGRRQPSIRGQVDHLFLSDVWFLSLRAAFDC